MGYLLALNASRVIRLLEDDVVIGRHRSATVRIDHDTISRKHARIVLRDGRHVIRDLDSLHGVNVNGVPIREHVLADGDFVQLGAVLLRYQAVEPDGPEPGEPRDARLDDAITGLPNRRAYLRHLSELASAGSSIALIWIDIDEMKAFNAKHGNIVGDRAIKHVARTIATVAAPHFVARQSGDELLIVIGEACDRAREIAEHVCKAASAPFDLDGYAYRLTVSAGIAVMTSDVRDCSQSIRRLELLELELTARAHLAAAKEAGRNRVFGAETPP